MLDFLGLSVLDLGPMYATHGHQTDVRQKQHLMPRIGAGHNNANELQLSVNIAEARGKILLS